jgi:putative flippase GtrA
MSLTVELALRLSVAARRPLSWLQLVKFGIVGASGYVLNLAVFATLLEIFEVPYIASALGAFLVALGSNYQWNRHWTFVPVESVFSGARYLTISCIALVINLLILMVLVDSMGLESLPAQAIAVGASMPFSFLGNRIWTLSRSD